MSYSDLLKDPRWQRKRLEILNRDNFTCVHCNDSENTLHVHHLDYEKKKYPWEVSSSNLQTVCKTCHAILEWIKDNNDFNLIMITRQPPVCDPNFHLAFLQGEFFNIIGVFGKEGNLVSLIHDQTIVNLIQISKNILNG